MKNDVSHIYRTNNRTTTQLLELKLKSAKVHQRARQQTSPPHHMLPPSILNERSSSITESSIMTARNLVKRCRSKGEPIWC
jgi:hypothetical protein